MELRGIGDYEQSAIPRYVTDIGVLLDDDPADRRGDRIDLEAMARFDPHERLALAHRLAQLSAHLDDAARQPSADIGLALGRDLDAAGHIDQLADRPRARLFGFDSALPRGFGSDRRSTLIGCVGPAVRPS